MQSAPSSEPGGLYPRGRHRKQPRRANYSPPLGRITAPLQIAPEKSGTGAEPALIGLSGQTALASRRVCDLPVAGANTIHLGISARLEPSGCYLGLGSRCCGSLREPLCSKRMGPCGTGPCGEATERERFLVGAAPTLVSPGRERNSALAQALTWTASRSRVSFPSKTFTFIVSGCTHSTVIYLLPGLYF